MARVYAKIADLARRQPRADEDEGWSGPGPVGTTVFEVEGGWEPSGILDEEGNPIYVYQGKTEQIGFCWYDESGSLRPRREFDPDRYGSSDC